MISGAFALAISPVWGRSRASLRRGLVKVPTQPGHHVTVFEHDGSHDVERTDLQALPGGDGVIVFRDGSPPIPAAIQGPLP